MMNLVKSIKTNFPTGLLVYLYKKPCDKCQKLMNMVYQHQIMRPIRSCFFIPISTNYLSKEPWQQKKFTKCRFSGYTQLPDKEHFIKKHESLFRHRFYKHYILDKDVADMIAKTVQNNREDKNNMLILVDSGPGYIVQSFLEHGANKIMCLENKKKFIPYLKIVQKSAGDKIRFISAETHLNLYLTSWLHLVQDVRDFLKMVPTRPWDDVPPLSMFIVLKYSRKQVLKFYNIIDKLVWKLSIYSVGRSELFVVIDTAAYKSLHHKIDANGNLRFNKSLPILYRTLFDIKMLSKIPSSSFHSQMKVKTPVIHKKYMLLGKETLSHKDVYLIHIVPKKNLHRDILPWEDIHKFKEFLQLLLFFKYGRLIPTMERSIPGCGIHLIKMDFTMAVLTGKLKEDDYLMIFKAMRHWPEYEGSPMEEILEGNPNQIFREKVSQSQTDEKIL